MTAFEQYISRCKFKYGVKFRGASLAPQFIAAYNSNQRVTVEFMGEDGKVYDVQRGKVSATTGWVPCFLLMRRESDHGSSYVLNNRARISTIDVWRKFKQQEASQ